MKAEFRTKGEILAAFKEMRISRPTFISMVVCIIVSLICMILPQFSISGVIDVSIFEMLALSGAGYIGAIVIVMHVLSLAAVSWPLLAKKKWRGLYFLPVIVTSVVSVIIFCNAATQLDAVLAVIQGFIGTLNFENIRKTTGVVGIIATIYMSVLAVLLMINCKEAEG